MGRIISASIDLTKIDKSRIVEHKNGSKYFNIDIMINDEKDTYGQDTSICATQTKQEREEKAKRVYIGNGKTVWESGKTQSTQQPANTGFDNSYSSTSDDDLPF